MEVPPSVLKEERTAFTQQAERWLHWDWNQPHCLSSFEDT